MSYIDETNIDTVFSANIKLPFDLKTCNWYPNWDDYTMKVESIAEFLLRIIPDMRVASMPVTILFPKTGYTPPDPCVYDYDAWNTEVSNFDGKRYAFIGGLADVNFIEIPGTASKIAIPFTNINNPSIPDYSIYTVTYGQYPQVELYFIDENGCRAKHSADPIFVLGIGGLIESINFGTLADPLTGFILLQ